MNLRSDDYEENELFIEKLFRNIKFKVNKNDKNYQFFRSIKL